MGGAALGFGLAPGMMKRAEAKADDSSGDTRTVRTICTHCSVGRGIYAEVKNGVWTGQEPAFDHPFNLGAHCAKGASVREHGHGERRLKYPTKLVDGKWKKVSWEDAMNEIGDKMLVIDPRFTRTAAHADQFLRIRPGTDVPLIWGMLWHIFKNGWEDGKYIEQRVYGMDKVAQEVLKC